MARRNRSVGVGLGSLRRPELLRRVTDNQTDHHPGDHDLPEVGLSRCRILVHQGDWERKERCDRRARNQADRQRIPLARDETDQRVFVAAAKGTPVLPKDGSWSVVQHDAVSKEVTQKANKAIANTGLSASAIGYLPVVNDTITDWIVLIAKDDARPLVYLNIDGW